MERERITELIKKYNAMLADPAELKEIENLIERGDIELSDLKSLHTIEDGVMKIETPLPSMKLDDSFYAMLRKETRRQGSIWKDFFLWPQFGPRLAIASVTLTIGIAVGFLLPFPRQNDVQVNALGQEINELKELVMLSLLDKESATERLKAVNLTREMDQASQKVTHALIHTLNNDENVNVRLAALDALKAYSNDSKVREELIHSISKQESPLVQISLAELMVALQAKSSVGELEKIARDKNTPIDVRERIEESIKILI
jgi:uncharacterized protein (UPF0147 family)